MNTVKFFICPMSKNIVDSVIELNSPYLGLLPTRRQIDFNGGYVNSWTTKDFSNYVKSKNQNIILERDHSGANQGTNEDNGNYSHIIDSNYFDIIHLDPWKKYENFEQGLFEIISNIDTIFGLNNRVKFEIGTEEDIRKFETSDLIYMLEFFKKNLSESKFKQIEYLVIQSGVSLDLVNKKNIGVFDEARLKDMLEICNNYNLKSKEHNGDYMSVDLIREKFNLGLDSINIAPEFGYLQTCAILENLDEEKIELFYNLCYKFGKWQKWVDADFVPEKNKQDLIKISGHYVYSHPEFLLNIHDEKYLPSINEKINKKLGELNDIL